MQQFFFPADGINVNYAIDGQNLFINAKTKGLIHGVFSSAQNYIGELQKSEGTIYEGGQTPMWVPFNLVDKFFTDKAPHATKLSDASVIDWFSFKENIFDSLYNSGYHSFISNRKAKELSEQALTKQLGAAKELEDLRKRVQEFEALEKQRQADQDDYEKQHVNPVIAFLYNAWFPVMISTVFAILLGGFSYEILSHTMGLQTYLNVMLSVVWVLFPIVTAVFQYQFDVFGFKLNPLWVAMFADALFTSYHVGWFRHDAGGQVELHWVIKSTYVFIIPFMQKSMNDLILKISNRYISKGYILQVA